MYNILKEIGDFIFLSDKPDKADAIMIVGGSYPELGEIAADLWKKDFAPNIFIGGGVSIKTGKFPGSRSKQEIYNKNYDTEYDFYKDVLLLNDVPENVIVGENRSSYTRENALFAKQVANEKGFTLNKVLLICKAFHARRCLMFYQSVFPDVEFLIIPFEGFGISKENWYMSEYGINRVLGELKRCGDQINIDDIKNYSK